MSNWFMTLIAGLLPLIVLGIIGAIWRNGIVAFLEERVRQGVKHEYDKKLEDIRAELHERGKEMEFLRSGALTAMSDKQKILAERQAKATDQIWSAIAVRRGALAAISLIAKMKPEFVNTMMEPRTFKTIFVPLLDIVEYDRRNDWMEAKPFVPTAIWELVRTYCTIVAVFAAAVKMLEGNRDWSKAEMLLNQEFLAESVKTALPEHEKMIEEEGFRCYDKCLEAMEKNILSNLKTMLAGTSLDKENVERADNIRRHADEAGKENSQSGRR